MAGAQDPFNLQRFITAQEQAHGEALAELRSGRKRSHWMWFIFPQLRGLGASSTSRFYGIADLDEARTFLAHPVLGPRLIEAVNVLLGTEGLSTHEIFGSPDDLKLRSCATLFARVSPPGSPFEQLLAKLFEGEPDPVTLERLGQEA